MNAVLAMPVSNKPLRAGTRRPRLGFLGVGWIGRHRLEAIVRSGCAEIAAIADASPELAARAAQSIPPAIDSPRPKICASVDELLQLEPDGIVIATPSALHAEQSIAALAGGRAVFCQKPLARTGDETTDVIEAARRANRLLAVDLSYRHLFAAQKMRELIQGGELGQIYAVELVFHNAYGPDKAWFYDRRLSGGGCLIDLGIHLVDLTLWMLGFPAVTAVAGQLQAGGRRLRAATEVEDYAVGLLELAGETSVQLSCSWKLPAGCDAVISAAFYGTRGGVRLQNVNGSFFDFRAVRCHGTQCQVLAEPPDDWGGRAAVAWVRQLACSPAYNPEVESLAQVAHTLDEIYAASR